jgi:enoyl-CoA hydratase/carnithine racemase
MNAPLDAALQPYVLSESRDGVATLTLNRGERFNPLSLAMIGALQAEVDRVASDAAVRSVVIAASGKGFSAGHDLKELRAHPDLAWQQELPDARNVDVGPIVCRNRSSRAHGIARRGLSLVSMCDLAVAADTARFALPA